MSDKNISKEKVIAPLWVEEIFGAMKLGFRVEKTLFFEKSPFQEVLVVETAEHGRVLLNDGMFMTTDKDEFVYHEMLAHVSLFTHPNPERVLVIGGGDGGTVREVLKHSKVKTVDLVEIDEVVVRASREFLPLTSSALNDPRVKIYFEDGVKFVQNEQLSYDVILIDSSDPVGPAAPLFGKEFYQDVFKRLKPDGLVSSQCESPFSQPAMQVELCSILKEQFSLVRLLNYTNMSYPGFLWSFAIASKKYDPYFLPNGAEVKRIVESCRYYHPILQKAAFVLPKFQVDALKGLIAPLPQGSL